MSCCEQRNEGLGLKRFTSVGDCGAVLREGLSKPSCHAEDARNSLAKKR